MILSCIDDGSGTVAAMQTTVDPYPSSAESLATSLAGEIHRLRYQIGQIHGRSQWYQDPSPLNPPGDIRVGVAGSRSGAIQFGHSTATAYTTLQSGDATATAFYFLPPAPPTAANLPLTSSTAGQWSWEQAIGAVAGGTGIDTSGSTGVPSISAGTWSVASTLAFSLGGTGLSTAADDTTLISSGSAWVASAVPNCTAATDALQYATATNAFSCGTISAGLSAASQAQMEAATDNTVAATPANTQYHPGVAKTWGQHNSAGAVAASYNVSSVTDNAAGNHTINLTTAFSGAAYSTMAFADHNAGFTQGQSTSASAIEILVRAGDTPWGTEDPSGGEWYHAAYGDQ